MKNKAIFGLSSHPLRNRFVLSQYRQLFRLNIKIGYGIYLKPITSNHLATELSATM